MKNSYIVAGCKPWSRMVFDEIIVKYPGNWRYVQNPDELKRSISENKPRYIFFMHWSWLVPDCIVKNEECVCFHMTDVPFGRGGSPLQNLIQHGFRDTKLTALKMTPELDAGPVYIKKELSLEGRAEDIFFRASFLAAKMIKIIVLNEPKPEPQVGEPTFFNRRKPAESEIKDIKNIEQLYDFIRMLDAEDYPLAFIDNNDLRFEFSHACLEKGKLTAAVEISLTGGVE